MCIAVPGRILSVKDEKAVVAVMGIEVVVNVAFLEAIKTGEWIMIHTGYAISKIEEEEAKALEAILDGLGE